MPCPCCCRIGCNPHYTLSCRTIDQGYISMTIETPADLFAKLCIELTAASAFQAVVTRDEQNRRNAVALVREVDGILSANGLAAAGPIRDWIAVWQGHRESRTARILAAAKAIDGWYSPLVGEAGLHHSLS